MNTPTTPKVKPPKKAVFYIDGQNLFHRLLEESERVLRRDCYSKAKNELSEGKKTPIEKDILSLAQKKFEKRKFTEVINARYLDFWAVSRAIAQEYIDSYNKNNQHKQEITVTQIKYYGSRYPVELDRDKHNADHSFYRKLENDGVIFREGKFLWDKEHFAKHAKIRELREKGVDVKLAVDLICDIQTGSYDHAFVISQDTDLIPAFEYVKNREKRHIHVRSINHMQGLDAYTDTNSRISIKLLTRLYKPQQVPSEEAVGALLEKYNKEKK